MRILYLGHNYGTSIHRANALERIGHDVSVLDPFRFTLWSRLTGKWLYETGGLFLENYIKYNLIYRVRRYSFDLVWIDGGALIGPGIVQSLKTKFGRVINYNIDDPFGSRDKRRWRQYLKSVPYYDLVVVVREVNLEEAFALGAKNVMHVFRSADEIEHAPQMIDMEDRKWTSEVLFVGTWMPERGPFLSNIMSLGIPLTIYGDRWQKAKEWNTLRSAWKGNSVYKDEYVKAIQCSKICLGLLSKGNRDLHTTRSIEIPYIGGVLCAERTNEHQKLYREGVEAVFWKDAHECALKCKRLLNDDNWRLKIANSGRARCIKNGYLNENVLKKIIHQVDKISKSL